MMEKPASAEQKGFIYGLVRDLGVDVDMNRIRTSQQASVAIKKLKAMAEARGLRKKAPEAAGRVEQRAQPAPDAKDRKMAYGMATKLVFSQYVQENRAPLRSEGFWADVRTFYNAYMKNQEAALAAPLPSQDLLGRA